VERAYCAGAIQVCSLACRCVHEYTVLTDFVRKSAAHIAAAENIHPAQITGTTLVPSTSPAGCHGHLHAGSWREHAGPPSHPAQPAPGTAWAGGRGQYIVELSKHRQCARTGRSWHPFAAHCCEKQLADGSPQHPFPAIPAPSCRASARCRARSTCKWWGARGGRGTQPLESPSSSAKVRGRQTQREMEADSRRFCCLSAATNASNCTNRKTASGSK